MSVYTAYSSKVTWDTADSNCRKMGGSLVSIDNEESISDIVDAVYKNTNILGGWVWTGGND